MPAINPSKLRFQIADLETHFMAPVQFRRGLRDLFSLYANRALKLGEEVTRKTQMPVYRIPNPVTRQLDLDLKPHIKKNPKAALALADELWKDDYFEMRQTAIFILQELPLEGPDPILSRLKAWLSPSVDKGLSSLLLSTGTRQLQDDYPQAWEKLIQSLLESDTLNLTVLGIRGLAEGVKNPSFSNIPAVFRLISPFIQNIRSGLQNELYHLIEILAQQAPTETGFFLRQSLSISEDPSTSRLVKRCLTFFPEKEQNLINAMLRK